jgi:RND family efflux transporter MFP subunit
MEQESLAGQGDAGADAASVTMLDQVLWSVLATEAEPAPFAHAWLALLCRMLSGAERAVLVLNQKDTLAPIARWPEGDAGSAQLSHVAELALEQRRGVVSRPRAPRARPEDRGAAQFGLPLLIDGATAGVVAVECTGVSDATTREIMRQLQWGIAWMELRQRRAQSVEDTAKLRQGFGALEVAASALSAETFDASVRAMATELAVRLRASRVSIGWMRRRRVRVVGLSHAVGVGMRSEATLGVAGAMEEAVDHGASLMHPDPSEEALPSLAAHRRFAARGGGPCILSVPLVAQHRIVGAMTIERAEAFDQATIDVAEAAAGLVGPVLWQFRQRERWLTTIAADIALRAALRLFGPRHFALKLASIAVVAIVAFFALYSTEYRVGGRAVVEGEVRRSIAAGLDGYVSGEYARAGQVVRQGDVIAKLDDSELNLQRLRWIATREQHKLELDKALAAGQRSEVNIDGAQIAEAAAEIALLDAQLARTQITAPFDGVITNGDLSQSVGMPVQRAQVLFEIAPLDSYRVVVRVPDADIAQVKEGSAGTLALTALPGEQFDLRVSRITPIAEQAEGDNTFRVEARLDGGSDRLRPNMEGVAKLDAGKHLLIWIWTHHLIEAVRLRLWSWWP